MPLFDYDLAFSRNHGITSAEQQIGLKHSTVAIAGMGGVGGDYLITLARIGVGNFKISDFDNFEMANFNRQYGATMSTIELPKMEVTYKAISSVFQCVKTLGINTSNSIAKAKQ